MHDAFREPMTLRVAQGAVVILGPDGLAAALTPDAAEESARRLHAAAEEARNSGSSRRPARNEPLLTDAIWLARVRRRLGPQG